MRSGPGYGETVEVRIHVDEDRQVLTVGFDGETDGRFPRREVSTFWLALVEPGELFEVVKSQLSQRFTEAWTRVVEPF